MSTSGTLLARRKYLSCSSRLLSTALKYTTRDRRAVAVDKPTGVRILTLKKGKAHGLPTMDRHVLRSIRQHVRMWDENYMVTVSFVTGPQSCFCNGMDLNAVRGRPEEVRLSLEALCRLVTTMSSSKTPLVSIMDGPCFGSGYALASGRYKVCTENSMFCVPEATLGLGLAGGLSHALPRLLGGNQALALCLALTGIALEGADLLSAQLATNYMVHGMIEPWISRLGEIHLMPGNPFGEVNTHDGEAPPVLRALETSSHLSWNIDGIEMDNMSQRGPNGKPIPHLTPLHGILPQVERIFAVESVEEAMDNLAACEVGWAQIARRNMAQASPLSLKVIFEQVKRGATSDIEKCLDDEYAVNTRLFSMPDFEQAMQARGNAEEESRTWHSGSLENVSTDQVAAMFQPVPHPRLRG